MKILKKYYKLIVFFITILIIVLLGLFIYKNLFESVENNRLENIEEYKLTKTEKTEIMEVLNSLKDIDEIDIYTNYKIIKIYLQLQNNVDFNEVKQVSNEAIKKISEKNLKYYDIEIFIDCNEECENYPRIGYKHKTNLEFTWNR